jgi:hypothetical protein
MNPKRSTGLGVLCFRQQKAAANSTPKMATILSSRVRNGNPNSISLRSLAICNSLNQSVRHRFFDMDWAPPRPIAGWPGGIEGETSMRKKILAIAAVLALCAAPMSTSALAMGHGGGGFGGGGHFGGGFGGGHFGGGFGGGHFGGGVGAGHFGGGIGHIGGGFGRGFGRGFAGRGFAGHAFAGRGFAGRGFGRFDHRFALRRGFGRFGGLGLGLGGLYGYWDGYPYCYGAPYYYSNACYPYGW